MVNFSEAVFILFNTSTTVHWQVRSDPLHCLVAEVALIEQFCYQTMPRASTGMQADMHLQPDLCLGASDASVCRVTVVVVAMLGLELARIMCMWSARN